MRPAAERSAYQGGHGHLHMWHGGTPREREVAGLVAQALSNREVARTLVLSERTVESHVRSILAKTGLTTRTEFTRWYIQRRPL
jgi:DNA-binding NarL/FixJ family response regulator